MTAVVQTSAFDVGGSLYPSNWPTNPFHQGEISYQKRMGSHESVMSYAPRFVRPYMPDQHRAFFEAQPFVVIAARDNQGRMWSTLLPSHTTSPDPQTLLLEAKVPKGDALEGMLIPGTDVGMIAIEFATKRRNRVNGRVVDTLVQDENKLVFHVDQSFGNCPQYIKPRQWWIVADDQNATSITKTKDSAPLDNRSDYLSKEQMARIRGAETIFVASGYRGQGEDPRFGNDASHRGGPKGFVTVRDSRTLILPDYSGNGHFNTIGNLQLDPRMGLTFPQYETGALLQITGRAKVVEFTDDNNNTTMLVPALYPGAERLIEIQIDQVVDVPPGSIPIRWTGDTVELTQRKLVVSAKIRESQDVMSFHLRPPEKERQELWPFHPGQHLPIHVPLDPRNPESTVERTYTISAGPDWGEYRISVKRQGKVSSFLHDHIHVGDEILVDKPAGDFILDTTSSRPLVLLSIGIGVTPMISMLHQWANMETTTTTEKKRRRRRPLYWVHGVRDSEHHPFLNELKEVQSLVKRDKAPLTTVISYSNPLEGDTCAFPGRMTVARLQEFVPDLSNADIYMCGNDAFAADMEEGLKAFGVPSAQIRYESF